MVKDRKSPFTSANLITYAFLAFIAFMAFLGAAAAAFAAFLAILLSTGERSKPQGMRMSLKTSFLGHEEATAHIDALTMGNFWPRINNPMLCWALNPGSRELALNLRTQMRPHTPPRVP